MCTDPPRIDARPVSARASLPRRIDSARAPVHTSDAPEPDVEKPARHAHAVEPVGLVPPDGQGVHTVAPLARLYVLAGHTVSRRTQRTSRRHEPQARLLSPPPLLGSLRTAACEGGAGAGAKVARVARARRRVGSADAVARALGARARERRAERSSQAGCQRGCQPPEHAARD